MEGNSSSDDGVYFGPVTIKEIRKRIVKSVRPRRRRRATISYLTQPLEDKTKSGPGFIPASKIEASKGHTQIPGHSVQEVVGELTLLANVVDNSCMLDNICSPLISNTIITEMDATTSAFKVRKSHCSEIEENLSETILSLSDDNEASFAEDLSTSDSSQQPIETIVVLDDTSDSDNGNADKNIFDECESSVCILSDDNEEFEDAKQKPQDIQEEKPEDDGNGHQQYEDEMESYKHMNISLHTNKTKDSSDDNEANETEYYDHIHEYDDAQEIVEKDVVTEAEDNCNNVNSLINNQNLSLATALNESEIVVNCNLNTVEESELLEESLDCPSSDVPHDKSLFNDTLEEMEYFLNNYKEEKVFKADQEASKIDPPKSPQVESRIPIKTKIHTSTKVHTPNLRYQMRPNTFKTPIPRVTPRKDFKLPCTPVSKMPLFKPKSGFKNVESPIAMYIKKSAISPLVQHVPCKIATHTPKNAANQSPRENVLSLPSVMYRPARRQLISKEKELKLPNNIQKLMPEPAEIIRHDWRTGKASNLDEVSQCNLTDLTINTTMQDVSNQDMSLLVSRKNY